MILHRSPIAALILVASHFDVASPLSQIDATPSISTSVANGPPEPDIVISRHIHDPHNKVLPLVDLFLLNCKIMKSFAMLEYEDQLLETYRFKDSSGIYVTINADIRAPGAPPLQVKNLLFGLWLAPMDMIALNNFTECAYAIRTMDDRQVIIGAISYLKGETSLSSKEIEAIIELSDTQATVSWANIQALFLSNGIAQPLIKPAGENPGHISRRSPEAPSLPFLNPVERRTPSSDSESHRRATILPFLDDPGDDGYKVSAFGYGAKLDSIVVFGAVWESIIDRASKADRRPLKKPYSYFSKFDRYNITYGVSYKTPGIEITYQALVAGLAGLPFALQNPHTGGKWTESDFYVDKVTALRTTTIMAGEICRVNGNCFLAM